jgi:multiple sugar transport system ATP-binding protein
MNIPKRAVAPLIGGPRQDVERIAISREFLFALTFTLSNNQRTVPVAIAHKTFGKTEVLRGIDLDIEDGEFCVFVGPSGCGKSTLLRLVAGLEDVSSGELLIDDQEVTRLAPSKRGVAIVFQSYALYPHMNVYDNMAFGLTLAKQDKAEIQKRVHHAAKLLQIDTLLDRLPKELSGGQRQRVAIGRAITRNPKVFLFDEPLSNLDAALRVQTRIEIANLHKRLATTMIYVTHDQVEAMTLADKIVVLNAGKVAQVGSSLELYHRPADLFVAGFIGSPKMNFLSATLVRTTPTTATVALADGSEIDVAVRAGEAKPGASVTLGIRPEHVQRHAGAEAPEAGAAGATTDVPAAAPVAKLRGTVRAVERLGEGSYVYLSTGAGDQMITIKDQGARRLPRRRRLHDRAGPAPRQLPPLRRHRPRLPARRGGAAARLASQGQPDAQRGRHTFLRNADSAGQSTEARTTTRAKESLA